MTRRRPPPDSLELLSDTLVNTFGCVLFIAMLVVVLLPLSGGRPGMVVPEWADPEAPADRREALGGALRAKMEALKTAARDRPERRAREVAEEIRRARVGLEAAERRAGLAESREATLIDQAEREEQTRRVEL